MKVPYYSFPGLKFKMDTTKPEKPTLDSILNYYGLDISQLLERNRKREIVTARMICICALRYQHGWTLVRIANYFNQHHTSVISALKTIRNLSETEESVKRQVKLHCPNILI